MPLQRLPGQSLTRHHTELVQCPIVSASKLCQIQPRKPWPNRHNSHKIQHRRGLALHRHFTSARHSSHPRGRHSRRTPCLWDRRPMSWTMTGSGSLSILTRTRKRRRMPGWSGTLPVIRIYPLCVLVVTCRNPPPAQRTLRLIVWCQDSIQPSAFHRSVGSACSPINDSICISAFGSVWRLFSSLIPYLASLLFTSFSQRQSNSWRTLPLEL